MRQEELESLYETLKSKEEMLVAAFIRERLRLDFAAHQPVLASVGRKLTLLETDLFIPSFGLYVEVCSSREDEEAHVSKDKILRQNRISSIIVKTFELDWKFRLLEDIILYHEMRSGILKKIERDFPEEAEKIHEKLGKDLKRLEAELESDESGSEASDGLEPPS